MRTFLGGESGRIKGGGAVGVVRLTLCQTPSPPLVFHQVLFHVVAGRPSLPLQTPAQHCGPSVFLELGGERDRERGREKRRE